MTDDGRDNHNCKSSTIIRTPVADMDSCADDISKLCQNIKPSAGTIQCLELHGSELTDACRDYEAKMHGRRGEIKEMVQEKNMFRQVHRDFSFFAPHQTELAPTESDEKYIYALWSVSFQYNHMPPYEEK